MQQAAFKLSTSHEWLLAAQVRPAAHVVFRSFVTETVLLNLQTGCYHGLNPTAGRMLEELERRPTVAEAAVRLAREYDQPLEQVERDLCGLCTALAERELVEIRAAPGG
jgi:hypothetical protein